VARHADDVHDRAGDAFFDHELQRPLHQEKRGPHVQCKDAVEKLRRGSRIVPAARKVAAAPVDEIVDPRESAAGRVDHLAAVFDAGQVGSDVFGLQPRPVNSSARRASADCVSPADDKTADHFFGDQLPGDRLPSPRVLPVTIATLVWGSVISCTTSAAAREVICR